MRASGKKNIKKIKTFSIFRQISNAREKKKQRKVLLNILNMRHIYRCVV